LFFGKFIPDTYILLSSHFQNYKPTKEQSFIRLGA
jgi:hypothetical protein